MKQSILLSMLIFTSLLSLAQEFTQPDTAAIRKSGAKSVKIYYTGTGNKHYFTQEYQYDKRGRCIFSREGNANYYYIFSYDEKSKLTGTFQRSASGNLIQGQKMDYYPNGKLFHRQAIYERDTIHPSTIYTYDTVGNIIEENQYIKEKLTRSWKNEYDVNKKIIRQIDSTPGKSVYEAANSKQVRQTYYNENNIIIENCLIFYDDKGRLNKTICSKGKGVNTYTVIYDDATEYHVVVNGKAIGKEEYVLWDRKFNWLMPRVQDGDNGLPYSDPVANYEYKHDLKRDKKGNIIKDEISALHSWMHFDPVYFEYEYEYW